MQTMIELYNTYVGDLIKLYNTYAEKYYSRQTAFFDDDISSLKKRIKHAKSPLEKKNLEKQLNLAYKSRKKRSINRG